MERAGVKATPHDVRMMKRLFVPLDVSSRGFVLDIRIGDGLFWPVKQTSNSLCEDMVLVQDFGGI